LHFILRPLRFTQSTPQLARESRALNLAFFTERFGPNWVST